MNFNDFYWHDSIIQEIIIDRSNPGYVDEIKIKIEFGNEEVSRIIVFENVYKATLDLNMGVVALESVYDAEEIDDDDDIRKLRIIFKGMFEHVAFKAYIIKTSSTGGTIKIIAKGFRIEE